MSSTQLGLRQRPGKRSCTEAKRGGESLAQQLGTEGKAKCLPRWTVVSDTQGSARFRQGQPMDAASA